jgi:hypothetical protein
MPAKSTPAKESTAVEVYDKEDEIELKGFITFTESWTPERSDPPYDFTAEHETLFEQIQRDEDQHITSNSDSRYVAIGIGEDYNIQFQVESSAEKFQPDAYDEANYGTVSTQGVMLYKEILDDELSSNPADKQISYYPVGNAAIAVGNSTNGADQYSPNFECDLDRNILITTSDGVKYCMPFSVAKAGRPDGGVSLLTHEQQYIAGIRSDTALSAEKSEMGVKIDSGKAMPGSKAGTSSSVAKSKKAKARKSKGPFGSMLGAGKAAKAKKSKAAKSPAERAKGYKSKSKAGISSGSGAKSKKAKASKSPGARSKGYKAGASAKAKKAGAY